MKKLFKRHYQAIILRGLITDNTNINDFLRKIEEEFIELCIEQENDKFIQEAIDLIMVCVNMLQYKGVNIESELLKNILVQEKRAKLNK